MTAQALICVLIWTVLLMFNLLISRSPAALAGGLVAGWLFLPNFRIEPLGLPDWNKMTLVCLMSAFGAVMIYYGGKRRPKIRLHLLDLPFLGLCFCAIATSISNGLGIYDGLASAYTELCFWVLPWFVGRLAFASKTDSERLIYSMICGALIYSVFCIYELKMSPRLHSIIFGMAPRADQNYFTQARRFGMWRPAVFMEHGLALSLLIGISSVLTLWFTTSGFKRQIAGLSTRRWAAFLGVLTVLCVSSGAILLTLAGWVAVLMRKSSSGRTCLLGLITLVLIYPMTRMLEVAGVGPGLVQVAETVLGPERAESFAFRMENEERMLERWRQQPLLGLASRFSSTAEGEPRIVTDSWWIAVLAKFGLLGWICWTMGLVLPAWMYALKMRKHPQTTDSPGWIMALCAALFAADCLLNKMPNPIYIVFPGAAVSLLSQQEREPQQIVRMPESGVARGMWPPKPSLNVSRPLSQ